MRSVLIVYGTSEGHTKTICEFIADQLESTGNLVSLIDVKEYTISPSGFDYIFIAAPIHTGGYPRRLRKYIQKYTEILNKIPSAFLPLVLQRLGTIWMHGKISSRLPVNYSKTVAGDLK